MTSSLAPRRAAARLAAALALSLALLAPAAAHAGAWGDPFRVSTPALEDLGLCAGPDVAIDDAGTVTYVWCQQQPTGPLDEKGILQSRVYRPDGSVGEIRDVTELADPGEVIDFRALADGSGTVHLAWLRRHESCSPVCAEGYEIEYVRLDDEGVPADAPLEVLSIPIGDDDVNSLSFDVNANGEALIGWLLYDGDTGEQSLNAVRVAPDGQLGTPFDVSQGSQVGWPFQIALADNGDAFAAWPAYDGTPETGAVAGRTIDADTGPLPIRTLSSAGQYVNYLEAFVDADGDGTVVFSHQDPGEPGDELLLTRRVEADGDLVGDEPVEIASDFSSPGGAGMADDGAITVAWTDDAFDLRAAVIDPTGTVGASNVLVPDAPWTDAYLGLAGDGSGKLLIGSEDVDTGIETLHGLDVSSSGTAVGEPVPLATETDVDDRFYVTGAVLNDVGEAAFAWAQEIYATDGAVEGHGAIYDGSAPDVDIWAPAKATAGQPVIVAGEGTDRSGVSYSWAFGDGGSASGRAASHAYSKPGSYEIALTATDGADNSVTVKAPIEVVAAGGSGGGPGDGSGAKDTDAPDTKILSGPEGRTRNRRPRFRFIASEAGATFQCKLDRGRWTACKSGQRLKRLRFGRHTFQVRARDAAGNVDRFADSRRFQVVKPKRKPQGKRKRR